jgi:hypothetical protein
MRMASRIRTIVLVVVVVLVVEPSNCECRPFTCVGEKGIATEETEDTEETESGFGWFWRSLDPQSYSSSNPRTRPRPPRTRFLSFLSLPAKSRGRGRELKGSKSSRNRPGPRSSFQRLSTIRANRRNSMSRDRLTDEPNAKE